MTDEATFQLQINQLSYNNDSGGSGILLRNLNTNQLAFHYFLPSATGTVLDGTLGSGTYELVADTLDGSISYSFAAKPIPAPTPIAALMFSTIACSRRRRSS